MSSENKFGFMKSLFNGNINEITLHHYPFFTTNRENDYNAMYHAIDEYLKANVDSKKFDHDKKIPEKIIQGLREMGLFGLIIPEEHGGSEFTQTLYCRTLELLSFYDTSLTLTVGAHSSIGLKGLYLYGTEEQKKKYMPRLATGEIIASFALTEPGAGSDAAAIKTRVVKNGDHYILNGSKLWITNGGFADFFTVFAKEEIDGVDKITAFLVTRDMGGITTGPEEQKLGIKASSTVEVFFKDTKVPVENILGKRGEGFKIAMNILNQGRVGLGSGTIGTMKSVFQDVLEYTANRKTFGQSINSYETIQNIIAQMAMNIYAAESVCYFTTGLIDSGDSDYSIEAAICKVFCTEIAWQTVNAGMQIHGGNGFMQDYGVELKLRDSRIGLIFEGTNEILHLFIAMSGLKEIAAGYQKVGKELQSIQKSNPFEAINLALSKIGFLSEFAIKEVKKSIFSERLEGFHPALEKECLRLASAAKILSKSSSMLIRKYGKKLTDEQMQMNRLADIAIHTYLIASVLSRINSVLEKRGGVDKNRQELEMARMIIRSSKSIVNKSAAEIKINKNREMKGLAKSLIEDGKYSFPINGIR